MKPVSLIADCPRCKGLGTIPAEFYPETCPRCHGKGTRLTEEGRTILGFLKLADEAGAGERVA